MADRTYVYVDGESHFIRSECALRKLHGENARLDRLRYVGQPDANLVLVNAAATFKSIDDLRRVPGSGPKTLEKLRPHITIEVGQVLASSAQE